MSINSTDPMIGRLIDGRYQVRSRIARGGMATVYLATDLRLERRVAIKVMHGHLADDAQYRARFIQEARSAARLAHPNVVNVYDQGQDDETAYLVMEYLPGITLRELLQEHPVLTTVQAMDIMEAVLSGLAAAHRNGIVHRDLKPENVLLADDGRIKIGDFGLARAATANTATGTALMGTIAYLSPELVTRGIADARSDIYAVGIMLYEMLAGEQPFKGDQPFQIAQQHANDTVPTPSTINPRVPAELDELVLWATAHDPDQRPRDAKAMLDQLLETQTILQSRPVVAPTQVQQTMVMPADSGAPAAETQVIARARPRQRASVADSTTTLTRLSEKRRAKGFWLFSLVLLLAALAGGTGWYFGAGPGSKVMIPSVSGADVETARATLEAVDLVVADEPRQVFSVEIPVGVVVGTDPSAGSAIAHGATVTLLVSQGPQPLSVPALSGLTEDAAAKAVDDARFALQDSQYQFHQDVGSGIVIQALGVIDDKPVDLSTLTEYGEGQPVTLIVSLGPVPSVEGLSVEDARRALQAKGLDGSTEKGLHEWSDTVKKGMVIKAVAPDDAPITTNTVLDLVVSDGVEQVKVPDVVGMSLSEAKRELIALGFVPRYNPALDIFPDAYVVRKTDPGAGKTVDKGSVVKISVKGVPD